MDKLKTINDAVVERICFYMGKQNLTQYALAEKVELHIQQ